MKILVADDERDMADALEAMLRREHYYVEAVYNGRDALDYGLSGLYDCLVLDLMMPGIDGLEVLTTLREHGIDTPILLLTARGEIPDRIRGRDAGADEYRTKPFAMGDLTAPVRALTRRRNNIAPDRLTVGDLTLDRTTFELSAHGSSLRLAGKEYQLLELLMRKPGLRLSTEQLMERIWGCDSDADVSVVWANISFLRRKLERLHAQVKITASRGLGYAVEAIR